MARAGILRAAIGSVMACLDPTDRRGNRASVGQILEMLRNDEAVVAVFPETCQPPEPGKAALRKILEAYDGLLQSDLFAQGRRLRNDAIAHVLITAQPTPTVSYETVYKLIFEACRSRNDRALTMPTRRSRDNVLLTRAFASLFRSVAIPHPRTQPTSCQPVFGHKIFLSRTSYQRRLAVTD